MCEQLEKRFDNLMMKEIILADLIDDKISGEWGGEPTNGSAIKVLRTTNFTNDGRLNLDSIVEREIDSKIVERKKLRFGDTIIEKSGGSPKQPVGRVVFYHIESKEPYLCNNFTAILRPSEKVFPKYFFYALFFKHLSQGTLKYQNKTTGILNLKLERYLTEEKIPLPDLATQKKVAGILEQADAAREKRKQANAFTEQFLQSAFIEMFGDPVKNEKKWERKNISELGKVQTGNTPSRKIAEYYSDDYIEWIKTDNILKDEIYPARSKEYLSEKGLRVARCVENDSILVTCIAGSPTTIGNVSLTNRKVSFNQQINSVTPFKDVNPLFLYWLFKICKPIIQGSTTHGMKRIITKSKFENIILIKPPYTVQQKFAQLVEQVEKLRTKQRESERELENLFQALMQRYFGQNSESLVSKISSVESYNIKNLSEKELSFAKQVLGGKIVSIFKDDKKFDHIKFQKLQYLAENFAELDLDWNYYRQAAGPYDPKFMHTVAKNLQENQWFEERNYKFFALSNANEVDGHYQKYFKEADNKISHVVSLLRNATSGYCELVATVYAVWNNLIIQKENPSNERIIQQFFEWSSRKRTYTRYQVIDAIEWLRNKKIIPSGFGYLIKEAKKK